MSPLINTPTSASIERHSRENAIKPVTALVFYRRNGKLALTTAHSIGEKRGVPHLEPGRPLAPDDEAKIVALLMGREDEANPHRIRLNPPNVLHSDAASTTWLCPSRVSPMVLRRHEGDKVVLARWPSLVMHARNRQLFVVALTSDEWPGQDAEVFHCPTGNVWKSTQVCTGSAVLPLTCTPADIPAWEATWFDSAFTHSNHNATITVKAPVAGKAKRKSAASTVSHPDPMNYWAGKDGDHAPFPAEHLTPLKLTLGEWISSLVFGVGN